MKGVSPRIFLAVSGAAMAASAQTYSMADYNPQPGLQAQIADKILTLTWDGEKNDELRMRLGVDRGMPFVREIAVRQRGGVWNTLAANLTAELEGSRNRGVQSLTY